MAKLTPEQKQAMLLGEGIEKPIENKGQEETVEKPKEVEKQEEVEKKEDVKEEVDFDISIFNKKFEREIESEDALKALFEKADKYDETKTSFEETQQKLTEYKSLAEKLDPMSNFLNEDEYIRQQFLKNNSDKLGEDAIKALSVLSPSKVKGLSDVDALKTDLMVSNELTSSEAEAYLLKKYDIEDFNTEDLDEGMKATIKVDVKNAKNNLSKIYEGINVPEKVDWETSRQELKSSWETPLQEAKKGLDKIQITEGVDLNITPSMMESINVDKAISEMMASQTKPSEAALASKIAEWRGKIVLENMGDVVKAIENTTTERVEAQWKSKVHNDKPFDNKSRAGDPTEDNESKISRIM